MVDFRVVPEALRSTANAVEHTSEKMRAAADKAQALRLGKWDLGILGALTNDGHGSIPEQYNAVLDKITQRLRQGTDSVRTAGEELGKAATFFEHKDYEYYKQFGYLDEKIQSASPGGTSARINPNAKLDRHPGGG